MMVHGGASSQPSTLERLLAPDPSAGSVEERLLWRCARVTLAETELAEVRRLGATLDAAGWARLAALAERNGVENLLFTHVMAAGLGPALPEDVALRLRERFGAVTLVARRLERRLEALLPLLEAYGAAAITLKGASLARRYYGGVTLRPTTDIDLLLRAEDEPRWSAALRAAGFAPVTGRGDPLGGHALRFRELQFRDAGGLLAEAHLALCRYPSYQRAFPLARIWASAQPTIINGVRALSLAPEDELRFLSLHYAVQHGASRLIWLVDVAELLRARGADLAWDRLVDETIARGAAGPVAVTLLRAHALLDAPAPAWARERLRAAALTAPELRAWADAHMPMDNWRRFLAQARALDSAGERLSLLGSGGASLGRRILRGLARH